MTTHVATTTHLMGVPEVTARHADGKVFVHLWAGESSHSVTLSGLPEQMAETLTAIANAVVSLGLHCPACGSVVIGGDTHDHPDHDHAVCGDCCPTC